MSDWCFSLDGCLCFPLKSGLEFFVLLFFDACHALHVARFSGPFSSFHASRALFHFAFLVSLLFSLLIRFLELAFSFLFFSSLIAGQQISGPHGSRRAAFPLTFMNIIVHVSFGNQTYDLYTKPNTFQFVHCSTRDKHAFSKITPEMCLFWKSDED